MVKNKTGKEKFEQELRKSVAKKILLLISVGITLFIICIFAVTYCVNRTNAANNLKMLKKVYSELYQKNKSFMLDSNTAELCKKALDNNETSELSYQFKKFNSSCSVKNEIILSDLYGHICYSSYDSNDLTAYQINYNAAVCHNAKTFLNGEIYNAVYYKMGNYADYIFVKPIEEENKTIGYISLFLSGDDWNFYMLNSDYDGVITDVNNNVMYSSKPKLISPGNKFYGQKGTICYYNSEKYWIMSESLPNYRVKIYSLIYDSNSSAFSFIIGFFIILIMGICWYSIAVWMANSMAKNNSIRINQLLDEIKIIQNGNQQHRIQINTKDEFSEVANQINNMLDSINTLNNRNTELIQLKNAMEISQLTAQMNPHFLYNTLETIRNLVLIDGKKAGWLIIKLTQILRYSIDNTKKDVRLEDDLQYIYSYLEIQKCRFGDRLHYTIDIDKICKNCIIPKLVLQPLIENSIKYGFKKKMNINIEIKGRMNGNLLILSVIDDGFGMPENEAEKLINSIKQNCVKKSYGLHSISRRLFLQYGSDSGLQIVNKSGIGFKVILNIMQWTED